MFPSTKNLVFILLKLVHQVWHILIDPILSPAHAAPTRVARVRFAAARISHRRDVQIAADIRDHLVRIGVRADDMGVSTADDRRRVARFDVRVVLRRRVRIRIAVRAPSQPIRRTRPCLWGWNLSSSPSCCAKPLRIRRNHRRQTGRRVSQIVQIRLVELCKGPAHVKSPYIA